MDNNTLLVILLVVVAGLVLFKYNNKKESYDVCSDVCSEADNYGCTKLDASMRVGVNELISMCQQSSQDAIVEAMEYCGDNSGAKFAKCVINRLS